VKLNQPKALNTTQDGSIELGHDQYASNEDLINRLAKSKSNSVLGVKHRKNSPQQNISIAQISETKRKQLEQKAMLGPLSPRELDNRNPAATPVRDRLTMIKSIYETNVLRDPVFLGSKNKLSQLRNLKEHHSGQSGSL
jgi:chromosome condensin MukBEF ATPase and DNA-binding subunit MukB